MKINKAYKFRLEPNAEQELVLNKLLGSARFVWNKILAVSFEMLAKNERITKNNLVRKIPELRKKPECTFLEENSNAVTLQQKVRDLGSAWDKFFNPKEHARLKQNKKKTCKPRFFKLPNGTEIQLRPPMPKFKKKADGYDSIRIVQFDKYCWIQGNKLKLPSGVVGIVKFRKSQEILGTIKNVTISKVSGRWYVSFGSERELTEMPAHPCKSAIGVDLGVMKLVTTSEGDVFKPIHSFKVNQIKIAKLQRKLRKKIKFSQNWKKLNQKINKLHHHIANIRHDYLHKVSTTLSKNHAMIAVEDLKVVNMSKSASGTLEQQGRNVKAKSGLNKSILDQGWSMLLDMLAYKQQWRGGLLVKVDPRYTSQTCSQCGYVAKENQQTQAKFECMECGYVANADLNASRNILAVGHTVLSVEGRCDKGHPKKQKASEIREEVI